MLAFIKHIDIVNVLMRITDLDKNKLESVREVVTAIYQKNTAEDTVKLTLINAHIKCLPIEEQNKIMPMVDYYINKKESKNTLNSKRKFPESVNSLADLFGPIYQTEKYMPNTERMSALFYRFSRKDLNSLSNFIGIL